MKHHGYFLRSSTIFSAPSHRRAQARFPAWLLYGAYFLLGAACVPIARAQQSAFANYLPTITTLAGTGVNGVPVNGTPASTAKFANPASVGWDAAGNLYILDKNKDVVFEVTASTGFINTIIGVSGSAGYIDGVPGTMANLNTPSAIAVDNAGNVYVADTKNNRIRKWTASTGIINSVAGSGSATYSGNGSLALGAGINGPTSVSVDTYGNLYISDAGDDLLRVVYVGGPVSAVPGLAAAAAALTPSTPQRGFIYNLVGTAAPTQVQAMEVSPRRPRWEAQTPAASTVITACTSRIKRTSTSGVCSRTATSSAPSRATARRAARATAALQRWHPLPGPVPRGRICRATCSS
jgi:hypothetical protein